MKGKSNTCKKGRDRPGKGIKAEGRGGNKEKIYCIRAWIDYRLLAARGGRRTGREEGGRGQWIVLCHLRNHIFWNSSVFLFHI